MRWHDKLLVLAAGLCAGFDAAAATVPETYAEHCGHCHAAGLAGAPKLGDAVEWRKRIGPGMALLYRSALDGMPNTAMMPKGGQRSLSERDIKALVDFMVAAAGLPAVVPEAAARYEARGITNRDFIRLDRNLDGYLSRDEVEHDAELAHSLARFDADRDGKLSEAEYIALETALERETAEPDVDDATLLAAVRAALARVRGLPVNTMKIEAVSGTVTMAGIVEDAEAARQAHSAIRRIKGIKRIDNRLVSGHLMSWD
jgi:cytochrome c5